MEDLKVKDEPTALLSQPLYDTDNAVDYSENFEQESEKRFTSTDSK